MSRQPKYAKRVDTNQQEIVEALRAIKCDVVVIGYPVDLLVGYRKRNFLIEIKREGAYVDKRQKDQRDFIRNWRGQVRQLDNVDEAIRLVTMAYEPS